jgi:hypothetical protein
MNFMLPPKAQCYVIYLFCVIWAASATTFRNLPVQVHLVCRKKSRKMLNFQGKCLNNMFDECKASYFCHIFHVTNFFCPIQEYHRRSNLSAWPTGSHLYVTSNKLKTIDNGVQCRTYNKLQKSVVVSLLYSFFSLVGPSANM